MEGRGSSTPPLYEALAHTLHCIVDPKPLLLSVTLCRKALGLPQHIHPIPSQHVGHHGDALWVILSEEVVPCQIFLRRVQLNRENCFHLESLGLRLDYIIANAEMGPPLLSRASRLEDGSTDLHTLTQILHIVDGLLLFLKVESILLNLLNLLEYPETARYQLAQCHVLCCFNALSNSVVRTFPVGQLSAAS